MVQPSFGKEFDANLGYGDNHPLKKKNGTLPCFPYFLYKKKTLVDQGFFYYFYIKDLNSFSWQVKIRMNKN